MNIAEAAENGKGWSSVREGLEPSCPFCRGPLRRPGEIRLSETETVLGARCQGCGAIYLVDTTGKNVGEVMMQALRMAAEDLDMNMADMVSGVDYEDAVLSYDWRIHRSSGVLKNFGDRGGRLYIIKAMKKEEVS